MTASKLPLTDALPESAADIEAAAVAWAAKVDRGGLSASDQAALEAWAAADPRRAGAYARALAASAYFDKAAALGPGFAPSRHPAAARPMDRRCLLGGAGALIAASVVGGVGVYALYGRGRIATPKGDVRRVSLSEGSAITLNTDTALRRALGPDLRRIDLLKGEALFDVAKDPSRPFVVFARGVQVLAVGTSFTVRLHDDGRVDVAVSEGVVEVRKPDAPMVRLVAETQAFVPTQGDIERAPAPAAALERALAWREGRIDLAGMSLARAAEEFARYSDRPILIEDPAVGAMKVTGVYSVNDPEGFARAAALSFDLEASADPGAIRIRRAGLS
ncbi:FecR family protein [Brevundimonas diminuta]|uniref:FecR family protein n=1 Tax=Brevundimonas diminuta TaxID=293 RepID=UPI003D02CC29